MRIKLILQGKKLRLSKVKFIELQVIVWDLSPDPESVFFPLPGLISYLMQTSSQPCYAAYCRGVELNDCSARMDHVGGEGTREQESGRKRGKELQFCVQDTVLRSFYASFNPLHFLMLVLFLPYVQIGKLRYHVIKHLVFLLVIGKP